MSNNHPDPVEAPLLERYHHGSSACAAKVRFALPANLLLGVRPWRDPTSAGR